MNCFIMKALTLDNDWFEFTIKDIPTLFNSNEFVLLNRPNTPKMLVNSIRRGDAESGLYEGDVIVEDGIQWLICYERGFYAINTDFVIKYLYKLNDYEVIGDCKTVDTKIPIVFRQRYLFKYNEKIFRLQDIVGAYQDKFLLRSVSNPVPPEDVKQECCITYNGVRVYLGDVFDGYTVELHGGRITLCKDGEIQDLITGGALDGYNT